MRLPNFFIVGAPKAGTTSLHHHLDQHPDIFMSPMKETWYFAKEFRVECLAPELQEIGRRRAESLRAYLDAPPLGKRFAGMVSEWEDYCRLFDGAGCETAVGEATPAYLWSEHAPGEIRARMPEAKVILILRNPVDRAYSQYQQMSNSGNYGLSFEQHLKACMTNTRRDEISMIYPFLEYGLYADQVLRYRKIFPAEQIGLWLYEETSAEGFPGEVFEFLGVDAGFVPDTSVRHLEQRVPRAPGWMRMMRRTGIAEGLRELVPGPARPLLRTMMYRPRGASRMPVRERAMLVEYYREDVGRLGSLLERDLSGWLGVGGERIQPCTGSFEISKGKADSLRE